MGLFDGFKKYIATGDEKVKDPVCGMQILKNEDIKSVFNDTTHYFCSVSCKSEFDKNPEKFVKAG